MVLVGRSALDRAQQDSDTTGAASSGRTTPAMGKRSGFVWEGSRFGGFVAQGLEARRRQRLVQFVVIAQRRHEVD